MNRNTIAFSILAMLIAPPAFAAAQDCSNETTQTSLNECYGKLADAADAELNKVYRQLVAKASALEKEKLRDAQRAWIAFRDRECDYETVAEEGGSIRPMEISICDAEKTETRTKEFTDFLACPPGDLSCVR